MMYTHIYMYIKILCTLQQDEVGLMHMLGSALELLEVLLEETSELSHKLAFGISQDLDVSVIISVMEYLWKQQKKWNDDKKSHLGDEAKRALSRAFHVMRKAADYLGVDWKTMTGKSNCLQLITLC